MKKKSNYLKCTLIIFFLISLFFIKGIFINIFSNVKMLTQVYDNPQNIEINILKENITYLKEELESLKDTFSKKDYDYDLTKISYIDPYNEGIFYIYNGKNKKYQKNDILVNENGVVGIIKNVYQDYSECITLEKISSLSVIINNSYGILKSNSDNLIIENISNYEEIHLNDLVYTSPKGENQIKLYIGYVSDIKELDIEKIITLKSSVEFEKINYLYVVGDL